VQVGVKNPRPSGPGIRKKSAAAGVGWREKSPAFRPGDFGRRVRQWGVGSA